MKRFLLFLTVLAFILSCGCAKPNEPTPLKPDDEAKSIGKVSLAFSSNDTLDPYRSKTVYNRALTTLLFDPLVKVDSDYQPVYYLADSISLNGTAITVKLKTAYFTDGTPVTAGDVIYSAAYASNSTHPSLSTWKFSATDDKMLRIQCNEPNQMAVNMLTFPIMKTGSAEQFDERNFEKTPIGCGGYILNHENGCLTANENYYGGKPAIEEIALIDTPDLESFSYNLKSGNISLWSDDDIENAVAVRGGTRAVATPSLLYLGINRNHDLLKLPQMRYALFAALGRRELCRNVYQGYAEPCQGIYPTTWQPAKEFQNGNTEADEKIYIANLKEIGYNEKSESGYYRIAGRPLSFSLLYCSDRPIRKQMCDEITAQLKKAGIAAEATGLPYQAYLEALTAGSFDLYLGEMRLDTDLNLTSLLSLPYGAEVILPEEPVKEAESDNTDETADEPSNENTAVKEAVEPEDPLLLCYRQYQSGETELYNFINRFNLEMPIIPLCYRYDILSYSKALAGYTADLIGEPYDCLLHIHQD